MEKIFYSARSQVAHFRLDYCCWFAPVRIGLMITGYFNIIADVVCLLGIANDGFSPTITRVQEILIEDFVNKPIPILAYATELGFSVVLLCAIHRRDLVLMRVFLYYTMLAVVMSFLIYSIVIVAVPLQIQLAIIFSTLFQIYVILLVRSVMVEMKLEKKQQEVPRLVMSSLIQEKTSPGSSYPKNGELQEVKITEVPKKQDALVTVVGKSQDDKIKVEIKDKEITKITDVKDKSLKKDIEDKDLKKNVEVKNVEVKVELPPKKDKDDKNKDEKKIKEETKSKEKKSKEEKKNKEEEKNKEEKKSKDEKKNKDEEKAANTKDDDTKDSKKSVKESWFKSKRTP